jgi:hypothetical protein
LSCFILLCVLLTSSVANAARPAPGAYGLFGGTSGTLNVTESGEFTGKYRPEEAFVSDPPGPWWYRYSPIVPISGSLDENGRARIPLRGSVNTWDLILQSAVANGESVIRAELFFQAPNFPVSRNLGTFYPTVPSGNRAGKYTVTLMPVPDEGIRPPQGIGWAVVTIKPFGGISIRGRDAYGAPFSTTAQLRRGGKFWFSRFADRITRFTTSNGDVQVRGSKHESMKGIVTVDRDNIGEPLSGKLSWDLRDAVFGSLQLRSSAYQLRGRAHAPFFNAPNAVPQKVEITFDDLSGELIVSTFALGIERGRVVAKDLLSPLLKIKFISKDGTFRGKIASGVAGKTESFSGVVLQNENVAVGQAELLSPIGYGNRTVGIVTMTPVGS